MQYSIDTEGMAEISEMLAKMEQGAEGAAARGLYEGAKVMADTLKQQIEGIRTAPFRYARPGEMRLPSPEEKAILEEAGIGVAKFDKNGTEVETSVGFNQSGYAQVSWNHMSRSARTNSESHQKPVGVIANAINSGTSFMQKQPFVRKAEKAGKGRAEAAIAARIEKDLEAMTK